MRWRFARWSFFASPCGGFSSTAPEAAGVRAGTEPGGTTGARTGGGGWEGTVRFPWALSPVLSRGGRGAGGKDTVSISRSMVRVDPVLPGRGPLKGPATAVRVVGSYHAPA